jgi:hypothetical protein
MYVIDNDFNHFKVNESHKLDIINMYNNIQTYEYCHLFDTDISFNTISTTHDEIMYTLLNPKKYHMTKATVISTCKTKIYKMYIFQNDKYKNYLTINALRDFYFHTKFREALINNNIQNIIVPEIYRYGIINIETNNEIICFSEMQYYDNTSIDELNNILDQEQSYRTKLEKTYLYLKNLYSTINTLKELEKQIQIYHNDIGCELKCTQRIITPIESVVNTHNNYNDNICKDYLIRLEFQANNIRMKNLRFDCTRLSNLFLSNNKYILVDFEFASTVEDLGYKHYDTLMSIVDNYAN